MQESPTLERGLALFRVGLDERAVDVLRRAVADDPSHIGARRYLAAALWRQGQRQRALGVLRDAVLTEPADGVSWLHLGAALLADGQWRLARYALVEAHLNGADDEPIGELLARIEARPERQDERDRIDGAHAALRDASVDADDRAAALADLVTLHDPTHLPLLLQHAQPVPGLRGLLDELGVLALGALLRSLPCEAERLPLILGALGRLAPALARGALADQLAGEAAGRVAAAPLVVQLYGYMPGFYDDLLQDLLADRGEAVAGAVADAFADSLPRLAPEPAEALVFAGLDARHEAVRERALERLAELVQAGHAADRALGHPSAEVRQAAFAGLAQAGEVERLRHRYADATTEQRVELLTAFRLAGAADLVALGLWDDEPAVRLAAAEELPRMGVGEEVTAPLRERLEVEPDEPVRAALRMALDHGDDGAAPREPGEGEDIPSSEEPSEAAEASDEQESSATASLGTEDAA